MVRVGMAGRKRRVRPRDNEELSAAETSDAVSVALQAAALFDVWIARLNEASAAGEKLAHGAGGGYFGGQLAEYQDHAKRMSQLLTEAKPNARCGHCAGAGCVACRELGYVCCASA